MPPNATSSGLRYSGQEASISIRNGTTRADFLVDVPVVNFNWSMPFELVKKDFIGQAGPDYREISNGYELDLEIEPNNGKDFVDFINTLRDKALGKITDEFIVQALYEATADGVTFQVTFYDVHWEGVPGSLGGRNEFLKSSLKGKGKYMKAEVI